MAFDRKAGILAHPSSLPGSAGIGTFGKPSFDFVDFLVESGMKVWQVLPLGPTGYGDSPYQSFSTFALNPLFIDFDELTAEGLAPKIRHPASVRKEGDVDYGAVVSWKTRVLQDISRKFVAKIADAEATGYSDIKQEFRVFCQENDFWLRDFAAFMSIKTFYDTKAAHEGVSSVWNVYWPKELARHESTAVDSWVNAHSVEFLQYEVIQFFAFKQWKKLHEYASSKGVEIIGDIPIFVASDSADVWANQNYFKIDGDLHFLDVAGVPPDYFSKTGQLWGNPLYDWNAIKNDGWSWWISRVRHVLSIVDILRLDHFRGFESYWAIPSSSATAENGKWEKGPGIELFDALKKSISPDSPLPVIAEDLGIITEDVARLRDECGFPGMKVLQFAFDRTEKEKGLKNSFLPHNFETPNCIVYTGTHDNDTTRGYVESLDERTLDLLSLYLNAKKTWGATELTKELVRLAFSSTARIAVIPLQDVYCIGSEGRMNRPSTSGSNWGWRSARSMVKGVKASETASWLKKLCILFGR